MKFIIQTINNKIAFDFELELINAIDSHNYFYPNDKIEYILDNDFIDYNWKSEFKEWCPIGSVEFVCKWFNHFFGEEFVPKPVNIPISLQNDKFIRRFVTTETIDESFRKRTTSFTLDVFVKDVNKIKSENNGLYHLGYKNVPDGVYQISRIINDIQFEYRCFVFQNELLDVRQYSGSFELLPDFTKIKEMIEAYKEEAPVAYTLDVAIDENNETIVIEVHDFFSCGLYGFTKTNRLPFMFWRWYYNYINKINYSKLNKI